MIGTLSGVIVWSRLWIALLVTPLSSLEGARRKLTRPVQPKEPLSVDTVCSSSLDVIRFLFILFVGFVGFFRTHEISNLSVKDVFICSECMSVFIPKRKNDQYREGHTSLWLSLIRLLAQFLLTRGYPSFFLYLVSHLPASLDELLNPSLRSMFMFLKAFLTQR